MLRIDEDKRREWLRALRRFKYGIKVRAKLGVLQSICEQVAAERKGKRQWDAPQWEHDRWVTFLYTCIRDNEFPPELLEGFVKTAEVTFFATNKQPTVDKVLDAVDQVCKRLSKPLRYKFGVFVRGDGRPQGTGGVGPKEHDDKASY
jgi:hypothetical protein